MAHPVDYVMEDLGNAERGWDRLSGRGRLRDERMMACYTFVDLPAEMGAMGIEVSG